MRLLLILISLFVLNINATIFGFYSPDNKDVSPMIDRWVTKIHTVQNFITGWTNNEDVLRILFNNALRSWKERSHVPMITWMPYAYADWTAPNPNELIANGRYDDYVKNFGKRLKVFLSGSDQIYGTSDDRRAYVRFAHQMNGNWFPWSPSCAWSCQSTGQEIHQSSTSYVKMWKYIVDVFDSLGIRNASRLQMVWSVNNIDFQNGIEDFYPGDNYVDWVGLDGYNFGDTVPQHDWETASQVFKDIIPKVKKVGGKKPIAITEFASVTSPKSVAEKSKWIEDAFSIFKDNNILMVIVFNEDREGPKDFAIFDGKTGDETYNELYSAYSAYRKAIQEDYNMIGANSTNIRLISDSLFMKGYEMNNTNIDY